MGLEEFRFVDGLEECGEARPEGHREQRMGERGEGDEDGDAGVADEVVIADQLEQEGGGGEGREALQRRGQREAFERVVQAGLSRSAMAAMARLPDDMGRTIAAGEGARCELAHARPRARDVRQPEPAQSWRKKTR